LTRSRSTARPFGCSGQALLCDCVAGAAASVQIEEWLAAAGFVDIRITVKAESREIVNT
jgi:hypothetical protein